MENNVKVETHAHSSEVSPCGHLTARELIEGYAQRGYGAVILTDHLLAGRWSEKSADARADMYLRGYREARKTGERVGVNVLLGMEARLNGPGEDYLVYGPETEDVPELMALLDAESELASLTLLCRARGWLLLQAHPFRNKLRPAPYALLDGAEVYNGNPRHDSHNGLALSWAKRGGERMILLGGSDAHQVADFARGGVMMPLPRTTADFVNYLKAHHRPSLIRTDDQ